MFYFIFVFFILFLYFLFYFIFISFYFIADKKVKKLKVIQKWLLFI